MTEISYGQFKTEVLDNTERYVHQLPKKNTYVSES